MTTTKQNQIAAEIQKDWDTNPRWKSVKRNYSASDVVRLRGSVQPEHTLAKRGAEKLWKLVNGEAKKGYVNAFGAISAGQAMQQAKAGLEAVYLSGWQVAADGNTSETMYPDQSLYAYDSVPTMVRRINNTFQRADEIQWKSICDGKLDEKDAIDFFLPIVADGEAGFGGVLNAYELMKNMIIAGAAGVHFEDQLAAVKKCGHMGGKVLVPTQEAVQKLTAARLAADSPSGARRNALFAPGRFYLRRASAGRFIGPRPLAPYRAAVSALGHYPYHHEYGRDHSDRGRPRLSRPRRAAARAGVGSDDLQRAHLYDGVLVGRNHSGAGDSDQ